MEINPIKNTSDLKAAIAEISAIGDVPPESPEFDRLDILLTLVEAYEAKVCPIPLPDPIGAILFVMDQNNLTRRDLEPYIGGSGRVSEILNRERPLTLAMMRRLHRGLGIPLDVLVQEYPLKTSPRRALTEKVPSVAG